MDKNFFIIPGFYMSPEDAMFKWLIAYVSKKGFKAVKVPVAWNYRTLTQNAREFEEFFNKNKGKTNYVLGFSYGAVITLLTANKLKPTKIYLCSLSSDFQEDRKYMKKWLRDYIGKRRYEDIQTRSGKKLATDLAVPSIVFYGEGEGEKFPQLRKRCEETAKLAKKSRLVVVPKSLHDIADPEYQKAIKSVI